MNSGTRRCARPKVVLSSCYRVSAMTILCGVEYHQSHTASPASGSGVFFAFMPQKLNLPPNIVMNGDTASVIAQFLAPGDIHTAHIVCKEWRDAFAVPPLKIVGDFKNMTISRGDHAVSIMVTDTNITTISGTNDISIEYKRLRFWYNFRGSQIPAIAVGRQSTLEYLVYLFGPSIADAVVLQWIPAGPGVKVNPPNNSGIYSVKCGKWTVTSRGYDIIVCSDRRRYTLYSTAALVGRRMVDTGFIYIGGNIWCADVATVMAVRPVSDTAEVLIHVLAAVYFCAKNTLE